MSTTPAKQIVGDVAVSRHIAIGGNTTVRGNATVAHNLKVNGWLEAPNIKDTNKGVFKTEAELKAAYPNPRNGWVAGVGTGTPFAAYIAEGGQWEPTGGTIEFEFDSDRVTLLENNFDAAASAIETIADRTGALENAVGIIDLANIDLTLEKRIEVCESGKGCAFCKVMDGTQFIGAMMMFSDAVGCQITQMLTTSALINSTGTLTDGHNDAETHTYRRTIGSNTASISSPTTKWTAWEDITGAKAAETAEALAGKLDKDMREMGSSPIYGMEEIPVVMPAEGSAGTQVKTTAEDLAKGLISPWVSGAAVAKNAVRSYNGVLWRATERIAQHSEASTVPPSSDNGKYSAITVVGYEVEADAQAAAQAAESASQSAEQASQTAQQLNQNVGLFVSDIQSRLDNMQVVNGDVTNNPDNEDLTSVGNALKLADRAYSPLAFSGKGYKILRKNIVDGANLLTQEMVSDANTVYEIRYDFDLGGETIAIPDDCFVKFNGGSIRNGAMDGIVLNRQFYPENFGLRPYDQSNDVDTLNRCMGLLMGKELVFGPGIYYVNKPIDIPQGNTCVRGNAAGFNAFYENNKTNLGTFILPSDSFEGDFLLRSIGNDRQHFSRSFNLRDIAFNCRFMCGGLKANCYDSSTIENVNVIKVGDGHIGMHIYGKTYPMSTNQTATFQNIMVYTGASTHQPAVYVQGVQECTLINVKGLNSIKDGDVGIKVANSHGSSFLTCAGCGNPAFEISDSSGLVFLNSTIENSSTPISFYSATIYLWGSAVKVANGEIVTQSNGFRGEVFNSSPTGMALRYCEGTFDRTLPIMLGDDIIMSNYGSYSYGGSSKIQFLQTYFFGVPASSSGFVMGESVLKHLTEATIELKSEKTDNEYTYVIDNSCSNVSLTIDKPWNAVNNSSTSVVKSGQKAVFEIRSSSVEATENYKKYDEITLSCTTGVTSVSFNGLIEIEGYPDLDGISIVKGQTVLERVSSNMFRIKESPTAFYLDGEAKRVLSYKDNIVTGSNFNPQSSLFKNIVLGDDLQLRTSALAEQRIEWTVPNAWGHFYLYKGVKMQIGDVIYTAVGTQSLYLASKRAVFTAISEDTWKVEMDGSLYDIEPDNVEISFAHRDVCGQSGMTVDHANVSGLGTRMKGVSIFDKTLGKPLWWNGSRWIGADGYAAAATKGTAEDRPSGLGSANAGFDYYDTSLGKKILWNGTEWVNLDGTALE